MDIEEKNIQELLQKAEVFVDSGRDPAKISRL